MLEHKPFPETKQAPSPPGSDPALPTVEQELRVVHACEKWLHKAHTIGHWIDERVQRAIRSDGNRGRSSTRADSPSALPATEE